MNTFRNLYITDRFFWFVAILIFIFVVSFLLKWMFYPVVLILIMFSAYAVFDVVKLFYRRCPAGVTRNVARKMSLGENNEVKLIIENHSNSVLDIELVDELPVQFQKRDFMIMVSLQPMEKKSLIYELRPTQRGEYEFGNINMFISSKAGLARRREIAVTPEKVAVYPSTVLMKKFEIISLQHHSSGFGIRKMRKIGHSYEFDHIRNYVTGDDPRSINWKATGRRSGIMVNNYVDEKAQHIYCLLDKSRAMQMPFDGLTLLDHAINTTLMILNLALLKHDKSGLLSFSNKIGNIIKANSGKKQLGMIYEALYKEKENIYEADYELMYNAVKRLFGSRSLLLLFTNFESVYAMERILPILRQINKIHLLVVIFFKNKKLIETAEIAGSEVDKIYNKTIARKFIQEKELIARELQKHKIQVIYTLPEDLPVNTMNKYLELKARGMI